MYSGNVDRDGTKKKKKTGKEKEKNFRGFSSSFFLKKKKLFFERKLLRAGLSIACSFTNGNDTDRRVLHLCAIAPVAKR